MPEVQIRQARSQVQYSADIVQEWKNPDGSASAICMKSDRGYIIQHLGFADFEIDKSDLSIICTPEINATSETLDHLYRNHIKPLVLGLRGNSVFHGSAVNIDGEAALFLGESGKGKSTLALSFATNSHGFLTDDSIVLERRDNILFVLPGDDTVRVWPDTQAGTDTDLQEAETGVPWSDKIRLKSGGEVEHLNVPLSVSAAYFLGSGGVADVTFKGIEKSRATVKWVEHSFLIDPQDSQAMLRQFEFVGSLSANIPCFELDYPREYSRLAEVRSAITHHVRGVKNDRLTD